jgi:methionyl-tRNA synthetase
MPFMHHTAEEIRSQLGIGGQEALWRDAMEFGLLGQVEVKKGASLFPRLDVAKELEELETMK